MPQVRSDGHSMALDERRRCAQVALDDLSQHPLLRPHEQVARDDLSQHPLPRPHEQVARDDLSQHPLLLRSH